MLKIKVFRSFAVLVLVTCALSGIIGLRTINSRIIGEAQTRVRLDLGSAWSACTATLRELEIILRLAAGKRAVEEAAAKGEWDGDLRSRLEVIRTSLGLDFLTVVARNGEVVLRAAAPHNVGDFRSADPAVARAMQGDTVTGWALMSARELAIESEGLDEQAFLPLEDTPHARLSTRRSETRGMAMVGATPIRVANQVLGVIYGGVLLNRNYQLVDHVTDVVFRNEAYEGVPVGTATIFLKDSRISTTVRLANGNRAIGTRVSEEVAKRALDNGLPWTGRAFVVQDWYLTAYDPIRDIQGKVIGLLYVGVLERPFTDVGRGLMVRYAGLSAFTLVLALLIAFYLAGRVVQPIHRLADAANVLRNGQDPGPVAADCACRETRGLVVAFNEMVQALKEREASLTEANGKLAAANGSLTDMNRNYMETLGFVSHELKSPLATMMNYVYLLKEQKIGTLNERQQRAAGNLDRNLKLLVEMVRHYLNLSRIEGGVLEPVRSRVAVLEDVVGPLLESFEPDLAAEHLVVVNRIGSDVLAHADMNMTREVFENLISNAIKYGREGGHIWLDSRREGDRVEFSVRNEGEGIASNKIGTLFRKFARLEGEKATHRQKGTGLGLFIVKHIVEAHGGTITVESVPNDWIEFRFSLPGHREEAQKPG